MRRFWFYVRLYVRLVSQYIATRMQYRFDFFISTFSMILGNLTGILSLWIIMSNMPRIAGWTFNELIFIYSFSLLAQCPLQICFDNIWSLRMHVNQGTFIKYYFKPINALFYYLSEMVDLKGFGQLVLAIVAFAWSSSKLGLVWTPERIVAFPLLLVGSALVISAMMLMAASGCFWVKDSFSILSFVSSFRDHSRYPLDIYDSAFRFIFTWVLPMGFIAYYPSQFFLRDANLSWTAYASPLFGAALFYLATRMWNRGMRVWGGTGT